MATIPTTTPTVDETGYVHGNGNITLNETVSAVNKNEPLFAVNDEQLKGYIALELYEQHTASIIGSTTSPGGRSLFEGISYSSGKPFAINEATWATGDNI